MHSKLWGPRAIVAYSVCHLLVGQVKILGEFLTKSKPLQYCKKKPFGTSENYFQAGSS